MYIFITSYELTNLMGSGDNVWIGNKETPVSNRRSCHQFIEPTDDDGRRRTTTTDDGRRRRTTTTDDDDDDDDGRRRRTTTTTTDKCPKMFLNHVTI